MNPLLIRTFTVVAGAAAVTGLIAAGHPEVTKARLTASLTEVYTNLYLQQAQILGHPNVTRASLSPSTVCDRGGPKVKDVGPGADWICHIMFTDVGGLRQDGKFELNAKSNGCYVATGPSRINGPVIITDTHGKDVLNPVFEFDSCYDPAG
jgi:hypothetical protein